MLDLGPARRPPVLDVLAVTSFGLSVLNIAWLVVLGTAVLLVGGASWLGGPVLGAIGTALAAVVLLALLVQSVLSLLLFSAALHTWRGDLRGRSRHLLWAWMTLILDLLDLGFTAGMDFGAWLRLAYALGVLLVMNRPEVRAYFEAVADPDRLEPPPGPWADASASKPAPLDEVWP
jgi:hypothetical protein